MDNQTLYNHKPSSIKEIMIMNLMANLLGERKHDEYDLSSKIFTKIPLHSLSKEITTTNLIKLPIS